MKNRLSTINSLGDRDLSKLPIYDLADLDTQIYDSEEYLHKLKEKLDRALRLRFMQELNNYLPEGEDVGCATFSVNGCEVSFVIGKNVIWDMEKVYEIVDSLSMDQLQRIIRELCVIDERKYEKAGERERGVFVIARTTLPKRPKFRVRFK